LPGYGFPKTARLNHPREFKQVFAHGQRQSDACFTLISMPNHENAPRLGLVVARKNLKRAVDRNRVKRMVRESFRRQRASLPARDIVVMVRSAAGAKPRAALRDILDRHWKKMADACAL
jgi:ribonuclease P protein component